MIGLSFDFLLYNILGFLCYSAFNVGLYWIPEIQVRGGHNVCLMLFALQDDITNVTNSGTHDEKVLLKNTTDLASLFLD